MARKSRTDALKTRADLLRAAADEFYDVGVSAATLNAIAARAGVTRGAVYVHFQNKLDLFEVLTEQVILPYETGEQDFRGVRQEGLAQVLAQWQGFLLRVAKDDFTRKIMAIIYHRCEWVGEHTSILARIQGVRARAQITMAAALEAEIQAGRFRPGLQASVVANLLHSSMTGLLHAWLMAPDQFPLAETGTQQLDMMLSACRANQAEPVISSDSRPVPDRLAEMPHR